jgi:hypothetical protein
MTRIAPPIHFGRITPRFGGDALEPYEGQESGDFQFQGCKLYGLRKNGTQLCIETIEGNVNGKWTNALHKKAGTSRLKIGILKGNLIL